MSEHIDSYRTIEAAVAAWAEARPDIHGVLVAGSRARRATPADEYSDLDLVLFADDPDLLIDTDDWLPDIGPVVFSFVEGTAVGPWRERRAVFEPMLDVDFSVVPTDLMRIDFAGDSAAARMVRPVLDRGVRVVYDEFGLLDTVNHLPPTPAAGPDLPDEERFTNVVTDFWYHAMWTTKKALRGERLVARQCLDSSMKDKLLKFIAWQARVANPAIDTWHSGRFFEHWADPDTMAAFHATYGDSSVEGILADLLRTMDLFAPIARSVSRNLGFTYPERAETHIRGWIEATVPDKL